MLSLLSKWPLRKPLRKSLKLMVMLLQIMMMSRTTRSAWLSLLLVSCKQFCVTSFLLIEGAKCKGFEMTVSNCGLPRGTAGFVTGLVWQHALTEYKSTCTCTMRTDSQHADIPYRVQVCHTCSWVSPHSTCTGTLWVECSILGILGDWVIVLVYSEYSDLFFQ